EFWDRYRKAELDSAISPLQTIKQAAASNWRAATWLLERKLPQNFAPTHRSMIDPNDVGAIFDRVFMEINRSLPPHPNIRRRIVRRIKRIALIAVHESTTKRKSPKIRPRPLGCANPAKSSPATPHANPASSRPHNHLCATGSASACPPPAL